MEQLYKIVMPDGSPCHGGTGKWHLPIDDGPGEWMPTLYKIIPCERGYHLLRTADIPKWLKNNAALFEAEADGQRIVHDDSKVVVSRARLLRHVGVLTKPVLVKFAIDCAERVLPKFEAIHPNDKRPREAIEAAIRWLKEPTEENADRAWRAANAAAAADSVYAAAAAAARAASVAIYAAVTYAARLADAAADNLQVEQLWQGAHLLKLLKEAA